MKAGFKPKLFTKKEWQDNRDSVCKGSGVGKALDAWQSDCPKTLSNINKAGVAKAYKAAATLDKALDVAAKKCDRNRHKADLGGIEKYKTIVSNYQKVLKLTLSTLQKRETLTNSLNLTKVTKDADLTKAFMIFAKKKQFIAVQFHTHLLCQKKKYADAVKLYGNAGKGGGEYNISNRHNKILHNEFVAKVYEDVKAIKSAIRGLEFGMVQMLGDTRHYQVFSEYETYKRILDTRFPLLNFSM